MAQTAPQPERPGAVAVDPGQRLEPVEIWGDRKPQDPGSFSAATASEIAETAADHPAEILNQLPGVNIQMNSGQEHLIAIRSPVLTGGAGQGSFLILENGVPTRSPAFGNVNSLIEPHHEISDAIEVVRGPGSAKYGSNAVHGLINVILPEPGTGSEIRASYGTLGRWRTDLKLDEGRHWLVNFSAQKDAGWRDNTGVDQQKLSVVGAFNPGLWDAAVWLSGQNLNQESGGFVVGTDAYKDEGLSKANANPDAYRDAWSVRLGARLERPLSGGTLILLPYAHSQAMIFSQHFLPYGGVEKNAHTGGGLMARYERPVTSALTWRIGADIDAASGYLREIQARPTFGFNPASNQFPQGIHYNYSVDTAVAAFWSELEWSVSEDVRILAGLRGERHDYDYTTRAPTGITGRFNVTADRSDAYEFLTPKLGAVWSVAPEIDLYANYARGARAPQVSDLYRLQNLQLPGEVETETLESVEVGARGSALAGRLVFDLAAYWMDKENFFFRDSNGLNVTDGSTRHTGAELSAAYDLTDTLSLSGNVSWSDQTYTFDRLVASASDTVRDGNAIDTAPEWLANARLDWQATDRLALSLNVAHVGEYFLDPANLAAYPGHTVLGARAAWEWQGDMDLWINVRNLTDERYADRADVSFGNPRYFPGEPANATFGLTKKF
ncbi:MAG: TonB-dependent receptor [Hyphomonas sp.]|nr:TonB-dependent receptor [Hyphomonas sp.]MBU3919476.1 TonB-dependent receptor [Alphaproteobacteria bacterium]MBU4063168.1 TonB-dependent receptor [Alphaproteobacteria bacterium]MBU4164485.1 TonB-dependent receptor [Alphaproteobacteria bacterium]